MGAVRDFDRERFFIESRDVAIGETAQQPIQPALLGFGPAQAFEFLLEGLERSQPVVLLRKPSMQLVHVSLFECQKKRLIYALG